MDVTYLAFQEPRHETAPPPVERRPVAPPEHRDAGPTQPAPPVVQPSTVPETLPTAPAGPELAPATGSDVDAPPAPSGGDGTDPNGPAWSGGGDGEVAQALDARMTRPQLLFRITPRYTESARRAHREGVVVVQATIDRTGAVTDVRLMKALGLGLDEEAMNAVRQWRYTPATLAGRPVPVFFQLTVTFTIR
jgi:protein TonB